METPARDFYRYLLLCGLSAEDIRVEFDKQAIPLPEFEDSYYLEQVRWASSILPANHIPVPVAQRHAGFSDMWAAHKNRRPGSPCRNAYHLLSINQVRNPLEALILSGYNDYEAATAITKSVCHYLKLDPEDVAAYRKYFFQPAILSNSDRTRLAYTHPHLRVAMLALPDDLLLNALGLRYNLSHDMMERSHKQAMYTWLLHLETLPLRSDREGIKTVATFLSSLKSLDRNEKSADADGIPLVQLLKAKHKELEEGLND